MSSPNPPDTMSPNPPDDPRLSTVSKQYDIGNKGYLTKAEAQMRSMDIDNQGRLSNEQVAEIVNQTLNLRDSNKNLRFWLLIMGLFAGVLALTNLGTAFAAARLAKDTSINSGTGMMVVKGTNTPVSTLSTGELYTLEVEDDDDTLYACVSSVELARMWNHTISGTATNAFFSKKEEAGFGLSFSTTHYNETHACFLSTLGDASCVEFDDERCTDQESRALIGHEHRRELFHHYAHGRELILCGGFCIGAASIAFPLVAGLIVGGAGGAVVNN